MAITPKFLVIMMYLCCLKVSLQDVKFRLYKAENPQESINIESRQLFCDQASRLPKFTNVFIIIHGWLHSSNEFYVSEIRKLLLRNDKQEAVVIEVDWSSSARKNYEEAKNDNSIVANATTDVLSCLIEDFKLPHKNIEIISHCMGSHIAGLAGKNILTCTGKKIGKIVALDPFGPSYFQAPESQRLGPNDANVVFVIHTDGNKFGFGNPCGTIDFYPNGGVYPQPGCPDQKEIVKYDMCSHQRSVLFYIESLNNCKFTGIYCPNYQDYKRGRCSSNTKANFAKLQKKEYRGTFFIGTNSKTPFLR